MMKIGVIAMTLFSLLSAGWFTHLFDATPTPPHQVPIELSKAGSIAIMDVRIEQDGSYELCLSFLVENDRNGNCPIGTQCGYINNFLSNTDQWRDENVDTDGTKLPVNVKIYKVINGGKQFVCQSSYITKGVYSRGIGFIRRKIITKSFDTGRYYIYIETLENFPELENQKAFVSISRFWRK